MQMGTAPEHKNFQDSKGKVRCACHSGPRGRKQEPRPSKGSQADLQGDKSSECLVSKCLLGLLKQWERGRTVPTGLARFLPVSHT